MGIDFIRIFAPKLYLKISDDPPSRSWMQINFTYSGINNDRKDSEKALELINLGELEPEIAFHAVSHLFPEFYSLLPETTKARRFFSNDHQRFKRPAAAHPIWHDEFLPLYFQISLRADHFPTSRYREFLAARDSLHMIKLFEEWFPRGWRVQLLQRLNDDPEFCESTSDPSHFLVALSSISDELERSGSFLEAELDVAVRLWFKRFSTVPNEDKLPLIERVLTESRGITIPLLILEYLRDRNGATYSKGATADLSIPVATKEEIESLTEIAFLDVEKRFLHRKFPVSQSEAYRFYRLAHAIGPYRLERILKRDCEVEGLSGTWAIAKAVVSSLLPQLGLNLFELKSVGDPASENVLKALEQFASRDYWSAFLERAAQINPTDEIEITLLKHLETALENPDGQPNAREDNSENQSPHQAPRKPTPKARARTRRSGKSL